MINRHGPRGICMRCGFEFYLSELRKEWTGLLVCSADYDRRHQQDFVRGVPDRQAVRNPSPEPADVFLEPDAVTADDL